MRNLTAAILAACALGASGAYASPFTSLKMADDSARTVEREKQSLVGFFYDKIAVSAVAVISKIRAQAVDDEPEASASEQAPAAEETCAEENAAKPSKEDDADAEQHAKAPVGPEPIYFGF